MPRSASMYVLSIFGCCDDCCCTRHLRNGWSCCFGSGVWCMGDFSGGKVFDAWLLLFPDIELVVVLKKRRISPSLLSAFRLLLSQLVVGLRAVGFVRVYCFPAVV